MYIYIYFQIYFQVVFITHRQIMYIIVHTKLISFIFSVVSCPFLKDPPDGIIHYSRGQGYKDTLTLECRPGYIYTEKLPRICEVNNQWSEREGQCLGESYNLPVLNYLICT